MKRSQLNTDSIVMNCLVKMSRPNICHTYCSLFHSQKFPRDIECKRMHWMMQKNPPNKLYTVIYFPLKMNQPNKSRIQKNWPKKMFLQSTPDI